MERSLPSPSVAQKELLAIIGRLREMPIGRPYNDILLDRDRALAESLLEIYPSRVHGILGIMATITGQEGAMRHHFLEARAHDPQSSYIRINHIVALQGFACFSEAAQESREACREFPRQVDLVTEAVHSCVAAGRFHEAVNWLDERAKLEDGRTPLAEEVGIRACSRFLLEVRVSDVEVETVQGVIASLLRECGVLGPVARYRMCVEEVDHWVSLRYRLPRSVAEVVQLEWELAGRLAAMDLSDRLHRNLVVGFLAEEINDAD
ncbi:MAG: hypothetical protein HQL56_06990 [Magnetococcales bacterium]|nr:hypothetical protein [Magnetococcales bacterium]